MTKLSDEKLQRELRFAHLGGPAWERQLKAEARRRGWTAWAS